MEAEQLRSHECLEEEQQQLGRAQKRNTTKRGKNKYKTWGMLTQPRGV